MNKYTVIAILAIAILMGLDFWAMKASGIDPTKYCVYKYINNKYGLERIEVCK